jgi:hypothetical protein
VVSLSVARVLPSASTGINPRVMSVCRAGASPLCHPEPGETTVNGNTVRSFSTHGQLSAAQGSSTTVSRSGIRLIQHLDSSARGLVRTQRLIGYFPIHLLPARWGKHNNNVALKKNGVVSLSTNRTVRVRQGRQENDPSTRPQRPEIASGV